MSGNAKLLHYLETSVRCKARKLGALITEQVRQSEEQARDRAHLATRQDRPYAGCNPYEPVDCGVSPSLTTNPAAAAQPVETEE